MAGKRPVQKNKKRQTTCMPCFMHICRLLIQSISKLLPIQGSLKTISMISATNAAFSGLMHERKLLPAFYLHSSFKKDGICLNNTMVWNKKPVCVLREL